MVSIVASQAIDPGSIPGRRRVVYITRKTETKNNDCTRLSILRARHVLHRVGGVKVSIVAFQAIDPGSIPG